MRESPYHSVDAKWIPILVIYAIVMIISIIIYKAWYRRYKRIPDKTVLAKLVKTSNYFGDGGPSNDVDSRFSYIAAKYEYTLNGKKRYYKVKFRNNVPDQITLYYKKGIRDIRLEKEFRLDAKQFIIVAFYFVVVVVFITLIIAKVIGIDINSIVNT